MESTNLFACFGAMVVALHAWTTIGMIRKPASYTSKVLDPELLGFIQSFGPVKTLQDLDLGAYRKSS